MKSNKKQRVSPESNTVDDSNTICRDGQSLSNSSDDEKASVTSVKGKTRATKGTATDPQSLYARVRKDLKIYTIFLYQNQLRINKVISIIRVRY